MKLILPRDCKICYLLLLLLAAPALLPATSPTLSANPDVVLFQYNAPAPIPQPVFVTITASDNSSPAIATSITAGKGTPATLFEVAGTGEGPDVIQVGINPTTFETLLSGGGIFAATLTVTASGFTALNIPITLTVNTQLSIVATPNALAFTSPAGPNTQTINLTGNGTTNVGFTFTFGTTSGGNWLTSVTSTADFTPATLSVTVNPLIVAAGSYAGFITVMVTSTGATFNIPITLTVGTTTFTANPTSLSFSYIHTSTIPPAQVVQLSSPTVNDTFTAQATSTGNWLLVNGVTTNVSGSLPATLNVTVSPASLAAGQYMGSIKATDANSNTQTINVTLVVYPVSGTANPTALMFLAQAGGAAPPSQTVVINGFGSSTYSAIVAGSWLSVSSTGGPAPGTITVTANPAGLAAGTYGGSIEINVETHVQLISATLVVSASPVLTVNPGDFLVGYVGGNPNPTPMTLDVGISGGASQAFSFAATTPSWLKIAPSGNLTTPQVLTITLTPNDLPSGSYVGQVIVTPSGPGAPSAVVPVLLDVSNAPPVTASATSLTFNGISGGAAQIQKFTVTATQPVDFTAGATTTLGGNWLSVTPESGIAGESNLTMTVTANPVALTPGTYHGDVTLTTVGGVITQVPVTFNVAGNSTFTVTPSSLTFAYAQGAALPPSQQLEVSGGPVSFTATAGTTSGGSWLAVTPTSGTSSATLTVTVNPAALNAGAYTGAITVTPAGGAAQVIAVTLTVSAAATLSATPSTLTFNYVSGNPAPPAQSVSVSSIGAAVTFGAVASSTGWLSVTPTTGTTPANLSVSVDPANLGAGQYTGSIVLTGANGALTFTVNVTLNVTAAIPAITSVVNAASYVNGPVSAGELIVLFGSSLGPTPGASATIDAQGMIGTSLGNVQVTFNGYPAPLLYAGSSQVNAIVPYEVAGASGATVELVFGGARSNSLNLTVGDSAPGIFSANESGQGGGAILDVNYKLVSPANPVSPGDFIQIFATGQGQTLPAGVDGLIESLNPPYPMPLVTPVLVMIDGIEADVEYAGAAPGLVAGAFQVNVKVPSGVPAGNATVVLYVGANTSQSGLTVSVQ